MEHQCNDFLPSYLNGEKFHFAFVLQLSEDSPSSFPISVRIRSRKLSLNPTKNNEHAHKFEWNLNAIAHVVCIFCFSYSALCSRMEAETDASINKKQGTAYCYENDMAHFVFVLAKYSQIFHWVALINRYHT